MTEAAPYVLLALLLGNPVLMLGAILVCRWYARQAQEALRAIEALADEEIRRG